MRVLLIAYDNGSYVSEFPLGLGYLAAVLRKEGHQVCIYSQDIYHLPPEHLTKHLDEHHYDFVGLGITAGYWQYKKLIEISKAVNASVNRKQFTYMLGGHGPSPEPEYFLRTFCADVIVVGEGERTIVELCDEQKYRPWNEIDGIAFIRDGKLVQTKPRALINDLDTIPFPAWYLFEINHYCLSPFPNMKHTDRTFPVLASRGCIFKCSFCYRMNEGIRFRSPQNIVQEIEQLKQRYHITYIAFYDELLMASPKRTKEVCDAIIDANLDIRWCCDGRLNFAKPDTLKLMKKAGCTFINYGIEAYDDKVLNNMHKQLSTDLIDKGLDATRQSGISPGLNIIFGNKGDSVQSLQQGVALIRKYNDYSQMRTIRPVSPYPGSELYYDALKEGKLKDIKDFYENKHKNSDLLSVNFTDLTDLQFYQALYEANSTLIDDYLQHQKTSYDDIMKQIYFKQDASFRGFRHT
jgi:radical SAM superfamily enzyme YgiQ (UPF0313 family)